MNNFTTYTIYSLNENYFPWKYKLPQLTPFGINDLNSPIST
jgi:hypothetical protein